MDYIGPTRGIHSPIPYQEPDSRGSRVRPFCGLDLRSYKVIPQRSYSYNERMGTCFFSQRVLRCPKYLYVGM